VKAVEEVLPEKVGRFLKKLAGAQDRLLHDTPHPAPIRSGSPNIEFPNLTVKMGFRPFTVSGNARCKT
jgi:hypothetical protein